MHLRFDPRAYLAINVTWSDWMQQIACKRQVQPQPHSTGMLKRRDRVERKTAPEKKGLELLCDELRMLGHTNTASALYCQITKTVTSHTACLM